MGNDIVKSEVKSEDPLTNMVLSKMVDGSIKVKRCLVCNSPFRADAEKMFEDGKRLPDIVKFFDSNGAVIPQYSVKNHMENHYKDLARMEVLLDYAENLKAIRQRRMGRIDLIQSTIDIGLMELSRVIPIQTNGDLSREKERTDLILRILKSIREGEQGMREIEGGEEEIRAIQQRFVAVWKAKIDAAKNDEEKQALIATLQDFRKLMQKEEAS